MLEWIETTLQAILDAYKVDNTTSITKVGVVNTSNLKKKFSDNLEEVQMLITYREMAGILPKMPVFDRVINANMYVYALEEEKDAVEYVIDKFISTYNATEQSTISRVLNFTNLIPLGNADNTGSKFYQAWQFGLLATVVSSLTTINDRSIQIDSFDNEWEVTDEDYWDANGTSGSDWDVAGGDPTGTESTYLPDASDTSVGKAGRVTDYSLNVAYYKTVGITIGTFTVSKGLVNMIYEKIPVYAEYPTDRLMTGKKIMYIKPRVTFAVLDNVDTEVQDLKSIIYDETYTYSITTTSNGKESTINGFIISAIDSITETGFPLLTFVIERG